MHWIIQRTKYIFDIAQLNLNLTRVWSDKVVGWTNTYHVYLTTHILHNPTHLNFDATQENDYKH